jgi:hypothetical protein
MKNGTSGFRMAHRGGAEGAEKRFFIKKYSELCELGVSVVNIPSQETRKNLTIESSFAVVTFPFTPSAPAAMRGSMCDCGACGNGNVLS